MDLRTVAGRPDSKNSQESCRPGQIENHRVIREPPNAALQREGATGEPSNACRCDGSQEASGNRRWQFRSATDPLWPALGAAAKTCTVLVAAESTRELSCELSAGIPTAVFSVACGFTGNVRGPLALGSVQAGFRTYEILVFHGRHN